MEDSLSLSLSMLSHGIAIVTSNLLSIPSLPLRLLRPTLSQALEDLVSSQAREMVAKEILQNMRFISIILSDSGAIFAFSLVVI